jgi:hypothetical protein
MVSIPPLPAGYLRGQSPDGRFIAVGDGIVSVASGQRVGMWPTKGSAVFASRGSLVCGVRDAVPAAMNVLYATEYLWSGNRKVRAVGTNGRFGGPLIIACSTEGGFAIVGDSLLSGGTVTAYRLSDGDRLWQMGPYRVAVASPDGRLLAVALPGPVLEILSMPDGRRIGTVSTPGTPVGFSGDGSLIAITLRTAPRFQSSVIEWPTNTTLWSHDDGLAVLATQPNGPGMILMTPSVGNGPFEVWLIRRAATAVRLAV